MRLISGSLKELFASQRDTSELHVVPIVHQPVLLAIKPFRNPNNPHGLQSPLSQHLLHAIHLSFPTVYDHQLGQFPSTASTPL